MKAEWLALLTAACWGVGGYFEKKGLHLGILPPQLGIAVLTTGCNADDFTRLRSRVRDRMFGALRNPEVATGGTPCER